MSNIGSVGLSGINTLFLLRGFSKVDFGFVQDSFLLRLPNALLKLSNDGNALVIIVIILTPHYTDSDRQTVAYCYII